MFSPTSNAKSPRIVPGAGSGIGRATALALVFSELLQNALEHGGDDVRIELAQREPRVTRQLAKRGAVGEADRHFFRAAGAKGFALAVG